jgi:hypothetical protein
MKCLAVSLSGCDILIVFQDEEVLLPSSVLQIILSSLKSESKVVQFLHILALSVQHKEHCEPNVQQPLE